MPLGRPKPPLVLTDEERQLLTSCAHRSRTVPHLALRARIILECATGADSKVVAKKFSSSAVDGRQVAQPVRPRSVCGVA